MKPYFRNFRTYHDFPFYKKIIWKIFGKKETVFSDDGGLVVAYTFKNITYIDRCDVYEY